MVLKRMKYELVVFDWDGTLLDSAGAIVLAIQAACRDIGHPPPSDERARHVIGLGLVDALKQLLFGISPRQALLQCLRKRSRFCRVGKGAVDLEHRRAIG